MSPHIMTDTERAESAKRRKEYLRRYNQIPENRERASALAKKRYHLKKGAKK